MSLQTEVQSIRELHALLNSTGTLIWRRYK